MDSLLLAHCVTKQQAFTRSSLKTSRDGLDHYLIQIFTKGQCETQNGRQDVVAQAGDVYVLDLAADYACVNSDFANLSLVVPRGLIDRQLSRPDSQHRRVIPGDQPLAQLFKEMIYSYYSAAWTMSGEDAVLSVPPLLRMTEGLLNSGPAGTVQDIDRASLDHSMLTTIKRYIEARLDDPKLRPETMISELAVSRSRLYRLFEPLGGVAGYIRDRRLRRSVQDLLDPAQRRRRIYEIAYDWGFEREGDYTRAFRRLFGLTPSEARAAGTAVAQINRGSVGPAGDRDYEHWLHDLARM